MLSRLLFYPRVLWVATKEPRHFLCMLCLGLSPFYPGAVLAWWYSLPIKDGALVGMATYLGLCALAAVLGIGQWLCGYLAKTANALREADTIAWEREATAAELGGGLTLVPEPKPARRQAEFEGLTWDQARARAYNRGYRVPDLLTLVPERQEYEEYLARLEHVARKARQEG